MLNVFHREGDTIGHFWGSERLYAPTEPGQDPRRVGAIEPPHSNSCPCPACRPRRRANSDRRGARA
ncbi:MAG: hypothetical protein E6J14_07370 [Chloroflexi bacterium]|nr:MAG: hypothetical protein E6J14_07370 [Chloroflexota bacterium]